MGKHAQLVVGPAGSGKSTYCSTIQNHCETTKQPVHIINLDPAADSFDYTPVGDIRDLISLDDVASELGLGPNGGLVYCMDYLAQNMEWLEDLMDQYDDDYIIFDCPGQIELYSHLNVMNTIINHLKRWGYTACVVYVLDSGLISDSSRFIAGAMMSLSAMIKLELPHINVLSKCDLLPDMSVVEDFLDPDIGSLLSRLRDSDYYLLRHQRMKKRERQLHKDKETIAWNGEVQGKDKATEDDDDGDTDEEKEGEGSKSARYDAKFARLNAAIASLIEDYSMVSFLPLNVKDEESIANVLLHVNMAVQYGEDVEPKAGADDQDQEDGGGEWGGTFGDYA